ncbi:galactose oxidase [Parathielavia appendiculata]|uniref:Galactose oxidase n=1 Tax=Parathielavia appendiculata TaxID=2587402 RepID=A0AAN6TQB5_9PEZI|nr:galactose oxidase [Parathielavia appendiculata]
MRLHAVFLAALHGGLAWGIPSSGHWKTLAPIPIYPRQERGIIPVPFTSSLTDNVTTIPSLNTTSLLHTYHIPSNTWSFRPLPGLPIPLNHPNAAVVDNKLYLLGGLSDAAGDGVWRGTGRSWVFDFVTLSWSELPSMPDVPRGSAAVGVDDETGLESVDVVSAFDTKRRVWVLVGGRAGKIPGRRDHAGCVVVDGVMYVLGGRDTGQVNVRGEVFALDLRRVGKGWVTKRGRMPTARGGVCAAVVGGKVFVLGGEGNPAEGSDGVFDQVEAYDTWKDSWERLGRMKVPRHGTSAVAVQGGVYIPGGGIRIGGAPVDTFDVFYP